MIIPVRCFTCNKVRVGVWAGVQHCSRALLSLRPVLLCSALRPQLSVWCIPRRERANVVPQPRAMPPPLSRRIEAWNLALSPVPQGGRTLAPRHVRRAQPRHSWRQAWGSGIGS